mmetsp:Transcript_1886/g.4168  ORF Transcript_1886/g.4168 Transcript_1886/m.4168 type:complete len:213 (-) Transcript_1886:258-896(-)
MGTSKNSRIPPAWWSAGFHPPDRNVLPQSCRSLRRLRRCPTFVPLRIASETTTANASTSNSTNSNSNSATRSTATWMVASSTSKRASGGSSTPPAPTSTSGGCGTEFPRPRSGSSSSSGRWTAGASGAPSSTCTPTFSRASRTFGRPASRNSTGASGNWDSPPTGPTTWTWRRRAPTTTPASTGICPGRTRPTSSPAGATTNTRNAASTGRF